MFRPFLIVHRLALLSLTLFVLTTWLTSALLFDAKSQVPGSHVSYSNITGTGTTTVKPAPGILHAICFNTATATEVITIWDSLSAAGTKVGTITLPAGPTQAYCVRYDVNLNVGITIQTATASSDITVIWE